MRQFHVLKAGNNDSKSQNLFESMHHLRWDVFYNELGWRVGLNVPEGSEMEFDEYDCMGAYYIVRINSEGEVDATCRLMKTSVPYMIQQHYPAAVQFQPLPAAEDCWEISRACVSQKARKEPGGLALGQTLVAAAEFCMVQHANSIVSLTTDYLVAPIYRLGWKAEKLGEKVKTPNDESFALRFNLTPASLQALRDKNNGGKPLLYDFDSNLTCIKELWSSNDNRLYSKIEIPADIIWSGKGSARGDQFRPAVS